MFANKDFVDGFASQFRGLLMTQEVKFLQAAPWDRIPERSRGHDRSGVELFDDLVTGF